VTASYVPAFDPKLPIPFEGDGAALFHYAATLDAIAEERGLPLFSSFADDREPPPDFDGFPEELHEAIGPWTAWFSPTDGLRCVQGLLDALVNDDDLPDALILDLHALADVLSFAKKRGARFRLEIA
jgi:hypothetical protein